MRISGLQIQRIHWARCALVVIAALALQQELVLRETRAELSQARAEIERLRRELERADADLSQLHMTGPHLDCGGRSPPARLSPRPPVSRRTPARRG